MPSFIMCLMKQFDDANEHQVTRFVFFPVYTIVNIQRLLPNSSRLVHFRKLFEVKINLKAFIKPFEARQRSVEIKI